MPTNYAKLYQDALANAFPKVLYFGDLWATPNKSVYKADEAHANTIYLPTIDTTGRVNGSRGIIKSVSYEPTELTIVFKFF